MIAKHCSIAPTLESFQLSKRTVPCRARPNRDRMFVPSTRVPVPRLEMSAETPSIQHVDTKRHRYTPAEETSCSRQRRILALRKPSVSRPLLAPRVLLPTVSARPMAHIVDRLSSQPASLNPILCTSAPTEHFRVLPRTALQALVLPMWSQVWRCSELWQMILVLINAHARKPTCR